MSDRRKSNAEYAASGDDVSPLGKALSASLDQALAFAHERNARVVQTLCFVSLLYSIERIASAALVYVEPQHWRETDPATESRSIPFLPGESQFDSARLPELAEHPLTRRRIAMLSSDAAILPADLANAFDTERLAGQRDRLCDAFELTVRHILGCPTPARCISRIGVRTAYHNIWIPRARQSFTNTLEKLADQFVDEENAQDESAIADALQSVSNRLNRPPSALLDANIERLERDFL